MKKIKLFRNFSEIDIYLCNICLSKIGYLSNYFQFP